MGTALHRARGRRCRLGPASAFRAAVGVAAAALLLVGSVSCAGGPVTGPRDVAAPGRTRLTRAVLDESLALGRRFLLNNQRPEGNFYYCYDFLQRRDVDGDSSVRQAGALWGLALIHRDGPSPQTAEAVARGLAFFRRYSRRTPTGGRYVAYPTDLMGSTGTVALVCLSLIETVRADPDSATAIARRRELDEYLHFLLAVRMPDGRFHARYDHRSGRGFGGPSPYYDGESLLALARAARYAGRGDLKGVLLESAERMYETHVEGALRLDPDSADTKGFYQWGTMAFYELYTSGWQGTKVYAPRAVALAEWMIDVHRTLDRTRNTAYAHEGMVTAWELARLSGDRRARDKIADVIDRGMAKLTSWQVGGPMENDFLRDHPTADPRAVGGVMNQRDGPALRIDVTQHQMHAVILARRFIYRPTE